MSEFVPASQLYDVGSRTPIAHPAHQATDNDVRRALEEREIRTDGGRSSSGMERQCVSYFSTDGSSSRTCGCGSSQEQTRVPEIGLISPSERTHTENASPQFSQTATRFSRFLDLLTLSPILCMIERLPSIKIYHEGLLKHSLHAGMERERGDR